MRLHHLVLVSLVAAAVVYGLGLWISRGSAARLEGDITNVRTLGMDERSSVAIVDFEARNPSSILMIVQGREVSVVDENGIRREGSTISASDLKGLFEYFPALGEMENEPFVDRVKVPEGESVEGLVAARFNLAKHELDARQELILEIRDVDGGVSEFTVESER